jgi:hypothetical protein
VDKVPAKFFSPITGYEGLFEIRIEYESIYIGFFVVLIKGN